MIVCEIENSGITQLYIFSESLSFLLPEVKLVLSGFCTALDFCED